MEGRTTANPNASDTMIRTGKRRYFVMPVPGESLAIVYAAFGPMGAEDYAKAKGYVIDGGSFKAEMVAVQYAQEKYGQAMVCRQRIVT